MKNISNDNRNRESNLRTAKTIKVDGFSPPTLQPNQAPQITEPTSQPLFSPTPSPFQDPTISQQPSLFSTNYPTSNITTGVPTSFNPKQPSNRGYDTRELVGFGVGAALLAIIAPVIGFLGFKRYRRGRTNNQSEIGLTTPTESSNPLIGQGSDSQNYSEENLPFVKQAPLAKKTSYLPSFSWPWSASSKSYAGISGEEGERRSQFVIDEGSGSDHESDHGSVKSDDPDPKEKIPEGNNNANIGDIQKDLLREARGKKDIEQPGSETSKEEKKKDDLVPSTSVSPDKNLSQESAFRDATTPERSF